MYDHLTEEAGRRQVIATFGVVYQESYKKHFKEKATQGFQQN